MINLMSFYYRDNFKYQRKDNLDYIRESLKIHIDSLQLFGWNEQSLVIKTNFDFQYKNIKAILNLSNFGHIRSPYHALLQSKGDATVIMMSDFQSPPELIVDYFNKWKYLAYNILK